MKFFVKLTMLALVAAIAVTGSSYALPPKSHPMMAATKSRMPVCKGATVYAVAAKKIYYVKGASMYGHAKGGSYMCMAAANGRGYKKG